MPWDDLHGELEHEFSQLVQVDVDVHRDSSPMHVVYRRKRKPISALTAEQRARTYARNYSYLQSRLRVRRAAKHTTAVCIRPGCNAPLEPPGTLKPGPVPQTCSRRCSNAVAYLRRISKLPPRHRSGGTTGGGVAISALGGASGPQE